MLSTLLLFSAVAHALVMRTPASAWNAQQFNDFVAFGDSYTDENRLNYFGGSNGSAPPPGTFLPESFHTAGGGRTWTRYVVQYTGSTVNGQWDPSLTLYDYAVSGAVCSNEISPRTLSSINANFPAVLDYEVPAFLADIPSVRNGTDEPYFEPTLSATDAVYSLWIGTNDVGVDAFLTDSQVPGNTLTDYMDCVYETIDQLYGGGGRYFVLMNLAPLDLAPLYANATQNGAGPNHYWPDKPSNITAISEQMREYTTTLNTVYQYQTPFEVVIANRYPGSNFAVYDVHSLMTDIYYNPSAFLNGTGAPLNVTGFNYHCNINGTDCVQTASPDSFMWYDELHPSEQTDRNIAKNFVDVLNGNGTYASYYSAP